jgi:Na+/H+ antiporter NhaC
MYSSRIMHTIKFLFFIFLFGQVPNLAFCQPLQIEWPEHVVSGRPCTLRIIQHDGAVGPIGVWVDDQMIFRDTTAEISMPLTLNQSCNVTVVQDSARISRRFNPLHPAWSLLPPLLAILFALWFREVYSSLLAGILAGSYLLAFSSRGAIEAVWVALGDFPTRYLIPALGDSDHQSIIVFSMLIGGMVALISRNGGMQGVVEVLARRAKTSQSAQFMTWLLGVLIFFDDYANTLLVGNTMRPVTDRLKVSREKLSYLVDATAAPVAAIAFISTWIGAEISYIEGGLEKLPEVGLGAYQVFLYSLSYAFYPIFTLIFMLLLIGMKRDFGPMYVAEVRARSGATVQTAASSDRLRQPDSEPAGDADFIMAPGLTPSLWLAILPVLVVVGLVMLGLAATGYEAQIWNDPNISLSQKLSVTIGQANAYTALLWGSFGGLLTAVFLTLFTRRLPVHDAVESVLKGFKTMLGAVVILILAWVLAGLTEQLETAHFLTQQLLSVNLGPGWLPTLTFILAALVAFSTGTSWGTMAILFPLVIPASWQLTEQAGIPHADAVSILCNVVSAVLAGSVLGDHCSPISDTTIMSSLASGCSHIEHVRTQLPYALVVGGVSIGVGTLPTGFGFPPWMSFLAGVLMMALIIQRWGKKVVD